MFCGRGVRGEPPSRQERQGESAREEQGIAARYWQRRAHSDPCAEREHTQCRDGTSGIPQQKFDYLSFEELSRLTEAVKVDPERWALVLLGADAGVRQREMIALEWGNLNSVAGALMFSVLVAAASSARPKRSGTQAPLTARLKAAAKAHRHLKSELVFCRWDAKPFTLSAIEAALRFGCKPAGLRSIGSHLRPARGMARGRAAHALPSL